MDIKPNDEINYILEHFADVRYKEKLTFKDVEYILSKLKIDDENIILEFIEKYIQTNSFEGQIKNYQKRKLLQYIKLEK